MASKFITNSAGQQTLRERLEYLSKKSIKLDFLVGYFFFSGFYSIYNYIAKQKIRILVGMDVELDLNNCIREFSLETSLPSRMPAIASIREKYFRNIKDSINNSDLFDNQEFQKSYRLFLHKLEDGTLEVRKTRDPNHAKMYLFYIPPENGSSGQDDSKVIIGSSNLSYQGLSARNEINVYLQDANDFKDAQKIFEQLWEDSIPLVGEFNKDEFKKEVLSKTWLEQNPDPFLLYIKVLDEFFKLNQDYIKTPKELTRDHMNQFFDVSYQIDAIREGLAKVKKHSGCIIADVVGLGKSIIASTIAANLDIPTIIITPPHLEEQWKAYGIDFGLRGCCTYTPGKLEQAVKDHEGENNLLIIIDEAHRYRNENTEAYGFLHRLCAGNKVLLLSATPFNNRPEDIFSLIKLFQIPAHSTIQTVSDLGNQMAALVSDYKKLKKSHRAKTTNESEFDAESRRLAAKIRDILDPVVIRRTRVDLENLTCYKEDLAKQNIHFSNVKPPKSQVYNLGELSDLYKRTLQRLVGDDGFIGARYKPLTYLEGEPADIKKYFDGRDFQQGQRNMAKFMQQLLVRRFESSKDAFLKTLHSVLNSMEVLKEWYEKVYQIPLYKEGNLPDIDDLEDIIEENSLFEEDEFLKSMLSKDIDKGLMLVPAKYLSKSFLKELNKDMELLSDIIKEWDKVKSDPKFDMILNQIKDSLKMEPKRKIIIFTEFSDTETYLYRKMRDAGLRVLAYDSSMSSLANREIIRTNFDAGYPTRYQKDDYDVLIATDAISEGFSLHRAGAIYNYDIPYNPTRVIQRFGRINRINKKVFDELYIYNFFPTATGERVSHTHEISTFKMKLFQAILGADTQILTDNETLEGYLGAKIQEEANKMEKESWDVFYRNELNSIRTTDIETYNKAISLPPRCRIGRRKGNWLEKMGKDSDLFTLQVSNGVLLFSKKGDSFRFTLATANGETHLLPPPEALALFRTAKSEESAPVSDSFYGLYQNAKLASGLVKHAAPKSRSVQDALSIIKILQKQIDSTLDKEYLEELKKVIELETMPTFYLKKIKEIGATNKDALKDLRLFLPLEYLGTLLNKDSKIESEPETILLSEELLGD